MALSLLTVNACNYPSCGLHYATIYDLIAHIELDHIPAIEEEHRLRSREPTGENGAASAPNLPMSCVQRMFTNPERPTPIEPEVFKISFNHYRKRSTNNTNTSASHSSLTSTSAKQDDVISLDSAISEEQEECAKTDPENRFCCPIQECVRRYKNGPALRYHMKHAHAMVINEDVQGAVVTAEGVAGGTTTSTTTAVQPTPSKAANTRPHKCPHCSKRYKTTAGLSNHLTLAHQKQLSGNTSDAPHTPSQDVVNKLITQAREHGLAAAAEQQRAAVAGGRLPVALAQNQNIGSSYINAPLPVRSIHVPSGTRYNPNIHPSQQTTGQMLQQQMNQRKLLAQQQQRQQQEQQALQDQLQQQRQSMPQQTQQQQQQMNMQQHQQQMHPHMQQQQQNQHSQQQQTYQQQQMYQQSIQYVAVEDGRNMMNSELQPQQIGQSMMSMQLQQGDAVQTHPSYSGGSRVAEMDQRRHMVPNQQQNQQASSSDGPTVQNNDV